MVTQYGGSKRPRINGEKLRQLRKDANLTQEALGRRIGLSRETISAIENDREETLRAFPVDTLIDWVQTCTTARRQRTQANESKKSFIEYMVSLFEK